MLIYYPPLIRRTDHEEARVYDMLGTYAAKMYSSQTANVEKRINLGTCAQFQAMGMSMDKQRRTHAAL